MNTTDERRSNERGSRLHQHGVPFAPLPDRIAARDRQAGVKQANLYRALAHAPRLLEAWIDFSWALREHCETPRALRELIPANRAEGIKRNPLTTAATRSRP